MTFYMAGTTFELEDMRGAGPVVSLDIDGEGLRVAVVREGTVWIYAGMGVTAGVTQEIGRYRKGAAAQCARWSPRPLLTDPEDIVGEYLLAVGKGDGSVTVLTLKRREEGRTEEWISFSKAKGHKAAINTMIWCKSTLASSSADHNIVLYDFDEEEKEPLSVRKTIKTGMEQISGFCICEKFLFAQDQIGLIRAWSMDAKAKQVLEVSFQPIESSLPLLCTSPAVCDHWVCFPTIPCTGPVPGLSLLLVNIDNFDLCEIPIESLYPSKELEARECVCVAGTARGLIVASSEGVALLDPLSLCLPTTISSHLPSPVKAIATFSANWIVLLGTESGRVYMVKLSP